MLKVEKIQKNIPIPPRRKSSGSIPFKDMEVGDSVLIRTKHNKSEASKLSGYATVNGYRLGKKFTVRQTNNGYRLWRTA